MLQSPDKTAAKAITIITLGGNATRRLSVDLPKMKSTNQWHQIMIPTNSANQ